MHLSSPRRSPRQPETDPAIRPMLGAVVPSLPPHAASPRSGRIRLASFALSPMESGGNWLQCRRGANTLPMQMRLRAEVKSSAQQQAQTLGCVQQLSAQLVRMLSAGTSVSASLAVMCAIGAEGMRAGAVALIAASQLGAAEHVYLTERSFELACSKLMSGAPACARLASAIPLELAAAAERRMSLNLHGAHSLSHRPHLAAQMPASVDVAQVPCRESPATAGSLVLDEAEKQVVESALVVPVADPNTGSTVALLLVCNSASSYFGLGAELVAESVALHVGLVWRHHLERLRLVPLPGAVLPSPDEAAKRLTWQWQAFCESAAHFQRKRADEAAAVPALSAGNQNAMETLLASCQRVLNVRLLELRHTLLLLASEDHSDPPTSPLFKLYEHMAHQWTVSTLHELTAELGSLGTGDLVIKRVEPQLDSKLRTMARQAARYHAKAATENTDAVLPDSARGASFRRRSMTTSEHLLASAVPNVTSPARPSLTRGGRGSENSFVSLVDQHIIFPTLHIALQVLRAAPVLLREREAALRKDIAAALTSDAPVDEARTVTLVDGHAQHLSLSSWIPTWTAETTDALFELVDMLGDAHMASAAHPALVSLAEQQASEVRVRIGAQLHSACQLVLSALQSRCWLIVEWIEAALHGRLSVRDSLGVLLQQLLPSVLRPLLAALARIAPLQSRCYERSEGFAPLEDGPSDPANQHLQLAADEAAEAFVLLVQQALDPLSDQFEGVLATVRPQLVTLQQPLAEELDSLVLACYRTPELLTATQKSLNSVAQGVQSALLKLEPTLLAQVGREHTSLSSSEEVAHVTRRAVKQNLLRDVHLLSRDIAALLATRRSDTRQLELEVQEKLRAWSEGAYVRLLRALTDHGGQRLAEAAMETAAVILPACAQRAVRELVQVSLSQLPPWWRAIHLSPPPERQPPSHACSSLALFRAGREVDPMAPACCGT